MYECGYFWWHNPHKNPQGDFSEYTLGISFLDEWSAHDFHVAVIMRTGKKKLSTITGQEFQQALSENLFESSPQTPKDSV